MVDPIITPVAISLAAKVFFVSVVAAVVIVITFKSIRDWFEKRKQLVESDKNTVGFTLKEKLESGDYLVYQGIFNRQEGEILQGHKIQGKNLDREFQKIHGEKALVIY